MLQFSSPTLPDKRYDIKVQALSAKEFVNEFAQSPTPSVTEIESSLQVLEEETLTGRKLLTQLEERLKVVLCPGPEQKEVDKSLGYSRSSSLGQRLESIRAHAGHLNYQISRILETLAL